MIANTRPGQVQMALFHQGSLGTNPAICPPPTLSYKVILESRHCQCGQKWGAPCPAPISLSVPRPWLCSPGHSCCFRGMINHPSSSDWRNRLRAQVSCRSQAQFQPRDRRTPPVPIRSLKPPLPTSIAWGTFKIREAPRFHPLGFCFGGSGTPGCLYFHSPVILWAARVASHCPKAPVLPSEASQSLHPSLEAGPVVGHFHPD